MVGTVILWIVGIGGSYILGSVPFGLVVGKYFCGVDPRESGSGNIGATNISRLCGTGYGLLVLLLDILKGLVPVLIAMQATDCWIPISLVGLACICGHIFSVFMRFKGGKGVATAIGVFVPLAFCPLVCALILCLIFIALSSYISVGSLLLFLALPVFLLIAGNLSYFLLAVIVMVMVYWRHRDNIGRLISGTEKTWRASSEKKSAS